ncbi:MULTISPECIES: ATPase [unclassified Burkholderia]|uniref:ATPase n=1 Tax=unclassified Burkholderia TaxID=2613784 RepID=UPI001423EE98|nr:MULTISPECIES: ATPase [unclassified Burkholderia]NIE81857.1 ATPase [Burkholderia sp. Tr-860]NIF61179.1 ATPase [Burkholderia sp. Cy-647]NIF93948.1 ATPase [Burkholderia sp. Ax-1720]
MSTINEEPHVGVSSADVTSDAGAGAVDGSEANAIEGGNVLAPAATPELVDARQITDGADDGDVERELDEMERSAGVLQREGLISAEEAATKRDEVARTRTLFRDLPPEQRARIVQRRREIGRELMNKQLSGAAVVTARVTMRHTRLKPLFEQWWPYLNRMTINMQRFGRVTYGANEQGVVSSWFEKQLDQLEGYVDEQLDVAKGFREKTETEMRERAETVFVPTVTKPSLDIEVEAYSRFSMRLLSVILKFDQVMDHFDFLVWNGIRDQSDVDDETARFLRKFHPVGLRGYTTHLKLMNTVRGN